METKEENKSTSLKEDVVKTMQSMIDDIIDGKAEPGDWSIHCQGLSKKEWGELITDFEYRDYVLCLVVEPSKEYIALRKLEEKRK